MIPVFVEFFKKLYVTLRSSGSAELGERTTVPYPVKSGKKIWPPKTVIFI